MNNEPVAWTNQNTFCKYCHRIPSQCGCTHPVKEDEGKVCARCGAIAYDPVITQIVKKQLTDEEITELANEYLCYISHDYEVTGIYKFARAILRKEQEK